MCVCVWWGGGVLGGSLANYSVAYEETQSNRVSDFRDFVRSSFPKAILFDFYFLMCFTTCYAFSNILKFLRSKEENFQIKPPIFFQLLLKT